MAGPLPLSIRLGLFLCLLPPGFLLLPPLVVISELCYYPLDLEGVERTLREANITVEVMPKEDICQSDRNLLDVLSSTSRLVIGSLKPELCLPVHLYRAFRNFSTISWNCPSISSDIDVHRQGPSTAEIGAGFARLVAEMKWKSLAIISNSKGWWPSLTQSLDLHLREYGMVPRHFFILEENFSKKQLKRKLKVLGNIPCRAIVLSMPGDALGRAVLEVLGELELHVRESTVVFVDVSALPSWSQLFAGEGLADGNTLLFTTSHQDHSASLERSIAGHVGDSLADEATTGDLAFELASVGNASERLVSVTFANGSEAVVRSNLEEWLARHSHCDECLECPAAVVGGFGRALGVLAVFACSCLFVALVLGAAAFARGRRLVGRGASKGPYKVVLTATDFVFPQIADSRRVDEGIEAMLCCWLQQLQEFGGPEVEKPDLLQNSGAASTMRTPARTSSSPNLAKQLIVDPRVRYNGDLVQMKPLPTPQGGGVELKAKSVEVLVLLHGLRHENINPLIGCLAEPPRAALVSEYCARGSLQDVLQQDDIKLDWSFRLSLLTDLVRGMKYLHSTPIRVHGYLTSRNCVIDARWVLKVTDYGLPSFYEAQGIQPPTKTARELLWTAPELLRHASLRKKGTQPGDVYSFGIILQEVVVRGEPFCMLALTPEEIIEKVKRPPPLIRPSVSKGAAPPEAINIMRQCWAEQEELRPDFNTVHDQFKKLNHGRKVNIVDTMFQMLEKYSNNLEELIRERTEQLDMEKKKTEQLLNRMLPRLDHIDNYVAEKLKLGMPVDPEEFEEVTIYFSDIVGFTTISAHSTPFQVVDLLNDLYTCFDATINAYNVYKVETIGDAYMVVGGLPVRVPDHAEQVATMALDLLHQSGRFRIRHLPRTPLRLRIGLHTGPCCAGVVGLTMPRYCLFGDTVNTASRMESTGSAWRIHMSEATKAHLERAGGYTIEYRGPTEIKGKGKMDTYWLLGRDGFDKPLPDPPSIDLDESLIVQLEDLQPCDSVSLESRHQLSSVASSTLQQMSDGYVDYAGAKSPQINPSFMRHMELSKFSSLARNLEEHLGNNKPEVHMVKSTSSDAPSAPLATPVSASEVAAALLGASTSSLYRRHRKTDEDDISTPYMHYKCLSPKQRIGKLLRRQFSLDRAEETLRVDEGLHISPRLHKQNSAGAADLEKIEEVPPPSARILATSSSPIQCTLSISVDSLIH